MATRSTRHVTHAENKQIWKQKKQKAQASLHNSVCAVGVYASALITCTKHNCEYTLCTVNIQLHTRRL